MARLDLVTALKAVEPETKAAQIRQVMPIIEQQLKAGVRRQAILDVLKEQGIEIGMETLKSYLYRYRKALKAEGKSDAVDVPKPPAMEAQPQVQPEPKTESVSYDADKDDQQPPIAPSELSKIMNPGDDVNASELARYESAGRSRRKST
ncbi:TraD protein [Pseudomonas sp. MPC6]|uniref:TraD protein n=1 Tax=unclassified Pseudomonas TaxID=196821 RepID=UPI00111011D4|nr:TraD protein [Pseudomonas sp. MPC6]QCY09343.1 TraD protein [Pseudomonas sp. MPC6]